MCPKLREGRYRPEGIIRRAEARSGHFACMTAPEAPPAEDPHEYRVGTRGPGDQAAHLARGRVPAHGRATAAGRRGSDGSGRRMAHRPAPMKPRAHVPRPGRARCTHARRGRACGRPSPCPGGDDNDTACIKAPPSYTRPKRHHLAALCFRCILQTWSVIPLDDDEQTELLTRLYLGSCPVDSVASKIFTI